MTIPDELRRAAEFHTHLGPFLVVGLRMGRVVTRELGCEPFTIRITANTGPVPPHSCCVDGLQLSTPCTVGNGGLAVADARDMSIEAVKDGAVLTIRLREDVWRRIENECTEENQETFACGIWEMPEPDLLVVTRGA
ncbi:MAG: formylmethanofuran dehydrogenase subunit E family protein [Candidatus Eisenbacteria bacterium]|nr:formylmethanofuran dehydrogenase subunit E family protein [Candidatus Eisenbacteria bacterium]